MNLWTPEKRNQVIFIAVATIGLAALLWLGGIVRLEALLEGTRGKVRTAELELRKMQTSVANVDDYRTRERAYTAQLTTLENTMAFGGRGVWLYNRTLDWSGESGAIIEEPKTGEVALEVPPEVPYEWEQYTISGVGFYHDIGHLVAIVENSSPFIRANDLLIRGSGSRVMGTMHLELLEFQISFVGLANTNAPSETAAPAEVETE